jgi:hypothetical protein
MGGNIHLSFDGFVPLFESYSDLDLPIVEAASENNLYLIGGTALSIWSKYYKIKFWRERSNNDIDFWTFSGNRKIKFFQKYLIDNKFDFSSFSSSYFESFRNDSLNIDVDILIDFELSNKQFCVKFGNINLMKPVYLFASKFDRFVNISDKQRKETDQKDLIFLLKIIEKDKNFKQLEDYLLARDYSQKEEDILNNLLNDIS